MTSKIVVLSTCANEEEAPKLAAALVELRLAACVTLVPGATSVYRWKGEVESSPECLLIVKSSRELFGALQAAIARLHSYQVPEIVALPIVEGAPSYLEWLDASLAASDAPAT